MSSIINSGCSLSIAWTAYSTVSEDLDICWAMEGKKNRGSTVLASLWLMKSCAQSTRRHFDSLAMEAVMADLPTPGSPDIQKKHRAVSEMSEVHSMMSSNISFRIPGSQGYFF